MSSLHPLLAAASAADPYPLYAELRRSRPFGFDPKLDAWVAADAAAVDVVLAEECLRVRPPAEIVPHFLAGSPAGEIFRHLVRMDDSPSRLGRQAAIREALGGVAAGAAATAARQAGELAAQVEKGELTLAELAFRMPIFVLGELLGLPDEELVPTAARVGAFVRCLAPGGQPDEIAVGKGAAAALLHQFGAHLAAAPQHRASPGMLAGLARRLPDDRPAALANAIGLLTQSYEATAGLIGNALVALARRPALRAELMASRLEAAALVRETARFDPPVQNTRRFAGTPLQLLDREIGEGQMLLVLLASANRDPARHPRPDDFDPGRPPGELASWGRGSHACPGSALAATFAAAAVGALAERRLLPGDDEPFVYRASLNTRIPLFGQPAPEAA